MLLKSIKVVDFRQFVGEQDPILFSLDANKNVTVIMGENGSGKTTLAQAFTWCLYGKTDFEDKNLLCKATEQSMLPNEEKKVRVELSLTHNGIDYTIIREQKYSKDSQGRLKRPDNAIVDIRYKNNDGQQEFVKHLEVDSRIKEILPNELSRYFFFDGERIENMSKEIRKGKSNEFAQAVKGLLGLNGMIAGLEHLNGRSANTVVKNYEKLFDDKSDSKIANYTKEITKIQEEISKIDERLLELEMQEFSANEKARELELRIKENIDSEKLAKEKANLQNKLNALHEQKNKSTDLILTVFKNRVNADFSKKLISDAIENLSKADKLDKGVPDIHKRTIDYIVEHGICICGTEIVEGNVAYNNLIKQLEYIPPQSIGTLINSFIRECELKTKQSNSLLDEITDRYSVVRNFENNVAETEHEIKIIEEKLAGLENVGGLQRDLTKYERLIRETKQEVQLLNQKKGEKMSQEKQRVAARNELTLKDETNRKIETYKAYAEYMYECLFKEYKQHEAETRENLNKTVNEIFKTIYNGGFSLEVDEKYNIQVNVDDFEGYNNEIETSTAQSISIIFAFIAGVIKMARKNQEAVSSSETQLSEPYPLVMDAPLSAFDKKRIETVCEVLPNVAEQVIIFIKDTDGEIAEKFMNEKIGKRYLFDKKNEFETYLVER